MPNFADLDESQLEQVRDALWSRQYYLLTGSGVSLDSIGPSGNLPSAQALRETLCALTEIPPSRSLQQAYSLLSPDQVFTHLTMPYQCITPGRTATKLASYPWRRVFTLNIDNSFQLATNVVSSGVDPSLAVTETRHFSDDFSDPSPLSLQSVVHLHGLVDRPGMGYVFSQSEYAKNITRPNSWMITLVQLIRGDPFIVCGTTLDEIDFTYYVEQRNSRSVRSDASPSILIEPYPDKLTYKLCEQHELYLFEGTTTAFFEMFEGRFGPPPKYWTPQLASGIEATALSRRDKVAFGATFEAVPKSALPDARRAPFLLGAPLTWETIEARADIARDVSSNLIGAIQSSVKDEGVRVLLLLDEPGSGKSALLKRLALQVSKQERNVFYFTGAEIIEEGTCAKALDAIVGPCFVFVDDWADHSSFFVRILADVKRTDIILVGAERTYRRPYIESGLADEDISIVESQLDLGIKEATRLIHRFEDEGLSSLGRLTDLQAASFSRQISGDPISIAACRIQNNFHAFDSVVLGLLSECSEQETVSFITVGISRYCYAGGVQRSVLLDAIPLQSIDHMIDPYFRLPLVYQDRARRYLVPARSAVADRAIAILRKDRPDLLSQAFADLANALAPHVNRQEIQARSPASKLSGALLDFDRVVKKFINERAEFFYDEIKDRWSWNSRYWEQCALLKLDRFLASRTDIRLLEEAIQNARYAYSIERHPLSLTTLAKMLFVAIDQSAGSRDEIFDEGWSLINQSIDIESRWANIKATAFVVCFNGILAYVKKGGVLNGEQTERLRDVMSVTWRRNLRDRHMVKLREEVSLAVF